MPGKSLNADVRDIVKKLIDYFKQEERNGGPLLPVHAVREVNCRNKCNINECAGIYNQRWERRQQFG